MKHSVLILTFCVLSYFGFSQLTPLSFSFDTIEPVYINTTLPNNVWQIGPPQKTIFNSAYSFPNVIVTDTINSYPNSNVSEFIVKTPTYIGNWGGVEMYFFHKYDTDIKMDGGVVEVSYDGSNWMNIIQSTEFFWLSNYYAVEDSVASLNYTNGFSGSSNGWEQTYCFWNYPATDTLHIKFIFGSDNIQNNREGWMIDSLVFNYTMGIGINEQPDLLPIQIHPNPSTGQFTVSSRQGAKEIQVYDLFGHIVLTTTKPQVDMRGHAKGVYFVRLGEVVSKLVVQ